MPVSFHLTARLDTGVILNANDVSVAAPVERAIRSATAPERIEQALRKTGGTPFYVDKVRLTVEDGIALSASLLNGLRRDALALLLSKRSAPPCRDWMDNTKSFTEPSSEPHKREFLGFTASVRTRAQANALRDLGLETIYVPIEAAAQTGYAAVLPRVFTEEEQYRIEMLLGEAMSRGTNTVLIGNLGQAALARRMGFTIRGDFGLNAFNQETLTVLSEMGVQRQTLSFEARLAQIRDMARSGIVETEMIVYGYLPLMLMENCVIKQQHDGKCSCKNGISTLTDRKGEQFALLPEFGCRNTLLNSCPLCLREDYARLGVQTARLFFTTESPETCAQIAKAFLSGAPLEGKFTRGLYKRGVE